EFKPGEGGRRTVIRPVSAEVVPPSAALPENRVYRDPAPAILGVESLFVSTVATPKDAAAARGVGGIVGIALEASLDPARNPDAVLLITGREFFDRPYVRADWRAGNVLRKGERSSLFGFTSNDPPTLDAVRVRGATLPAVVPVAN